MTVAHRRSGSWRRRHPSHEAVATETSSVREPFGISQMFAAAFGVFFIILGAVALARAGVDSMTAPRVEMMGLRMTPLLAIIHLAMGVLVLASAVSRSASRGMVTFFGAGLIAMGIMALIQPVRELGWTQANGAAYLIAGAMAIVAAAATPAFTIAERRVAATEEDW